MCELLGMSAGTCRRVNDLLREFYSHAEEHPHGWGLARFPKTGAQSVVKEPVCATRSVRLAKLLDVSIAERAFIAHIRFATIGHIEYVNCHPFTTTDNRGRIWTLAHNGTIFDGVRLNDYTTAQSGETDSERLLLHLVAAVNHEQTRLHRALDESERFDTLSAMIAELAPRNKLNLLFFDGDVLYAHCNFKGTLLVRRDAGVVTFSTRALSGEGWEPLPFTCLVAAKDGEIVRTSPPHGNEYFYNPNDYRMLYMDFARL
ncbi:MAG: class II glutamine amidotransferase [Kiritimatiellae bacterium]|nr:class II glutamine amidotransferase [Kiritimatiellia bacterium]